MLRRSFFSVINAELDYPRCKRGQVMGVYKANKSLAVVEDEVITEVEYQTRVKFRYNGKKQYELSNHLGNVLVTISDRRKAICNEADSTLRYEAVVITASDYYSFGSPLIGRTYQAGSLNGYRFSINGQEKDDEIYGEGNATSAEYWEYDTRLGRRWNLDPVIKAWQGGYLCFSGNPIGRIDQNGADDYFNADGTFSNRTKTGSRIFVCTADGNKKLSEIDVYKAHNAQTVAKITAYYAQTIGVEAGTNVGVHKQRPISEAIAFSDKKGDKEYIYLSAGFGFTHESVNDYNNLKSTLFHEKRHLERNDPEKGKTYNYADHAAVYEDQMNDKETWEPTTFDFKVGQSGNYVSYLLGALNNSQITSEEFETKVQDFNTKNKDIKIECTGFNQATGGYTFKVSGQKDGKKYSTGDIAPKTSPQ